MEATDIMEILQDNLNKVLGKTQSEDLFKDKHIYPVFDVNEEKNDARLWIHNLYNNEMFFLGTHEEIKGVIFFYPEDDEWLDERKEQKLWLSFMYKGYKCLFDEWALRIIH